jgi:hypothetical protein
MSLIPRGRGAGQALQAQDPAIQIGAMATRVRRLFAQERDSALATAERIRRTVQSVGRSDIDAALGADASELTAAYVALKAFILTLDPDAEVPDLPE